MARTVMESFEKDARLVALSGPYLYTDLHLFGRVLVKAFYFLGWLIHLVNHHVLRAGAMVQGGNFCLRRSAFDTVGGFDTSIPFYGEDTDVARRLSRVGKVRWTWRLPMYSSARRLKAEGIVTMSWRYSVNHFSVLFSGRPVTSTYRDVRSE